MINNRMFSKTIEDGLTRHLQGKSFLISIKIYVHVPIMHEDSVNIFQSHHQFGYVQNNSHYFSNAWPYISNIYETMPFQAKCISKILSNYFCMKLRTTNAGVLLQEVIQTAYDMRDFLIRIYVVQQANLEDHGSPYRQKIWPITMQHIKSIAWNH